MSYLLVTDV